MDSDYILVIGSIITDLISYTKTFPKPGQTSKGVSFKINTGGKGANQAVAASKLGSNVIMVACVGNDIFGMENIKNLKNYGVNIDNIKIIDGKNTAIANVMVDENGENITIVNLEANLCVNVDRIKEVEELIKNSSLIMLQNGISHDANLEIMRIANKCRVDILYNAAPGIKNLNEEYLKLTSYLVVNENETEFLVNRELKTEDDFVSASKELLKYVKKAVVLTRGKNSTVVSMKNNNFVETFTIPVSNIPVIDTTGAGDCFCGSFGHGLITRKLSIKDSTIFASKIASISVQKYGTQSSYPFKEEINF
uniref:Ribokinase n=1 Tax=Parastrongyloides trichosuri TaxID=131310 RepID=A0A0N4ZBJ4_PARTI